MSGSLDSSIHGDWLNFFQYQLYLDIGRRICLLVNISLLPRELQSILEITGLVISTPKQQPDSNAKSATALQ